MFYHKWNLNMTRVSIKTGELFYKYYKLSISRKICRKRNWKNSIIKQGDGESKDEEDCHRIHSNHKK